MRADVLNVEKKRTSGCLIAAVVVGLVLAVCCTLLVFITAFAPGPRAAFAQLRKTAAVALKARGATGTKELREAGCADAYVIEVKDVPDQFIDAGTFEVVLTCHVREKPVTCDEAAAAYRAAPGASLAALKVIVVRADKSRVCEGDY